MTLLSEISPLLLLSGFLSVLILCVIILASQKWHLIYSSDTDIGPQKIHSNQIPRIGGIALLAGLLTAYILKLPFSAGLLIGILPVFLAGISEDISKKIPPFFRLGASIVSAVALVWVLSLQISAKGIPLLVTLFSIEIIALSITALAIALMAQSINIIDGLNGLSIGTSLIMTCAIAIIAAMNGDFALAEFSLFFGACLAGILVINFPRGLLFLGDGGAYLLGCVIAVLAILLAERNSSVSSFASLLIVSYPIYETLRSFIRRTIDKNTDFFIADDQHLHSIMYRFISNLNSTSTAKPNKLWATNAFAGMSCWLLPLLSSILAVLFQSSMPVLLICVVLIILVYETAIRILAKS